MRRSALTQDLKDLHTYGIVFAPAGSRSTTPAPTARADFDANALAKPKGGTPFKRPENGVFRPGSGFREFFFTETGDTNALDRGQRRVRRLRRHHEADAAAPVGEPGTLTLFFLGDVEHTALRQHRVLERAPLVAVEDRGRHAAHATQRARLGVVASTPARTTRSRPTRRSRIIAQGRDASATIDSALLGSAGYQNDGDNEITGIHVSDGDPGTAACSAPRTRNRFATAGACSTRSSTATT